MKKAIFTFILSVFAIGVVSAHAIWLETSPKGSVGSTHEVRLFFAEPNETEKPVATANWYSDLNEAQIVLTSPSGKKQVLTKKQAEFYYSAEFKIEENGIYTLSVNHLVKKVYKRMRIRYQTVAFVSTLDEGRDIVIGDKKYFQIGLNTASQVGTQTYKALFKKKPFKNEKITFDFSVDNTMTLETNANGEVTIPPNSPKKYIVNLARKTDKKGKHHGTKHLWDYEWLTYYCGQ